jgi:hypothetical protein
LGGMEEVMRWAAYVGAWLLFAGPIYQGSLELQAEPIDGEAFDERAAKVPKQDPIPRLWWLLPPVAGVLLWRRQRRYRRDVMAVLTADQRRQASAFLNKATGWFIVATGALLLGGRETWELATSIGHPVVVFVGLALGAIAASILYVRLRGSATRRAKTHEPATTPGDDRG